MNNKASLIGSKLTDIDGQVPGGLCVRDTMGREFVTMRHTDGDPIVHFTAIAPRRRHEVANWTVVADFRH